MFRLILVRHGESVWNHSQRFTGWADVDITDLGISQMRKAGHLLRDHGIDVDLAFTSALRRCIRSQWELLLAMDRVGVRSVVDWRLNERHYGALTGMSKAAAVLEFGPEAVHRWRRSFDAQPPQSHEHGSEQRPAASHLQRPNREHVPNGESLAQVVRRVRPLWDHMIAGAIKSGKRVVVTAHGNSLRALIKLIESVPDDEIVSVEVPNAMPLVYELDATLKPVGRSWLGTVPASASEIL